MTHLQADSLTGSGSSLGSHDAMQGRKSTRVLVVEPESRVRASVTQALDKLGYRHVEAFDPREAIALLQSPLELKGMICSSELPGLSGRRLAQLALVRRPGLRVALIVSDGSPQSSPPLDGCMRTLTPSFTLPALAEAMES